MKFLPEKLQTTYNSVLAMVNSSDENNAWLKAKFVDVLNQFWIMTTRMKFFMTKEHMDALKQLNKNDTIVIAK